MFFATLSENNNYINCKIFNIENNNIIEINSSNTNTEGITKFHNIKSARMEVDGKSKALVCATISKGGIIYLFYAGYDINTNTFYENIIPNPNNCIINTGYIFLSYFRETEQYIASILNTCSSNTVYLVYSFNNNFEYSFFGSIRDFTLRETSKNCQLMKIISNNLHSILFSSLAQKYCFVWDYSMLILNKKLK